MRCKTCDYPLWTIRARQCPECGAPFKPSDFVFAPNAVRFQCPHCAQSYYGTDERGHLVPRSFTCVRCAEPIDMDEMVLLPGEGVDERRTTAEILPWLDKRKRRTGAWRTIGLAMTQPRRMMDITPIESSVGRAWWFYLLLAAMITVLSGIALVAMGLALRTPGGLAVRALMSLALTVGALLAWLALWGLVAHGLMKVLGAGPKHTIGRTYQALCYSSGVMVPSALPCVGGYIFPAMWIWWLIGAALAVPRAQGARAGRGAAAVLVLPTMLALGSVGFIVWFVGWQVPTLTAGISGTSTARTINGALRSAATGGRWPDHGARLLANGSLTWFDLVDFGAISGMPREVAGIPVATWEHMSKADQSTAASAMAGALPPDWTAHRVEHVVFTYNGIDPSRAQDPGLWVFFFWPDPTTGASWRPRAEAIAMRADGTTDRIDPATFAGALATQNALRQTFGLAPLPNPASVHGLRVDPHTLKVVP